MPQRYDNFADWYDTYVTSGIGQPFARSADRLLAQILGPGDDRLCLDLGCSAGRLPRADDSVDAVPTIITTTDFDDLRPVLAEARRVLRPGGRLAVVAAHPCFGGVFAERDDQGSCIVHPGYRRHQRIEEHPLLGDGIRARVGVVNVPLPVLLNALTSAGFILQETAEDDGDQPIPNLLALAAIRPSR